MGFKRNFAGLSAWLLAGLACAHAAPQPVTVQQILQDPKAYAGQEVRVHGFVTFEFENNRLWRDEAAFRNYEPDQAIYLAAADLPQDARDATKGRLAFVTGTVDLLSESTEEPALLTHLTGVEHDPADHKPDRGWWSDPQFGALLGILGPLALIAITLLFATRSRLAALPSWKPGGSVSTPHRQHPF